MIKVVLLKRRTKRKRETSEEWRNTRRWLIYCFFFVLLLFVAVDSTCFFLQTTKIKLSDEKTEICCSSNAERRSFSSRCRSTFFMFPHLIRLRRVPLTFTVRREDSSSNRFVVFFQMASAANTIVDRAVESSANTINPAAAIPDSMKPFVQTEMTNLKQIANNFLARHFQFRTKSRDKTLDVVQLMSEYEGNFSTPVAYL